MNENFLIYGIPLKITNYTEIFTTYVHEEPILERRTSPTVTQPILELTGHALFGYLPVVHPPLHGTVTHQSVDVGGPGLSVAIHSAHSLSVVAWVPGDIQHHHTVSPYQVDTQATGPAGKGQRSSHLVHVYACMSKVKVHL